MFGIGFQEMLLILVVILIFFGPKRLPDLAKSLGKGLAEFKKASDEVKKGIDEAMKEETAKDEAAGQEALKQNVVTADAPAPSASPPAEPPAPPSEENAPPQPPTATG